MNQICTLLCVATTTLLSVSSALGQAGVPVIGGFDTSRCSLASVPNGASYNNLRAAVRMQFPNVEFTSTPTLTAAYLNTIDVLMIAPGGDRGNGIYVTTELTSAEQAALANFVSTGGGAIIMVDNWNFGCGGTCGYPNTNPVNQSFIAPFGLHVTGKLSNPQFASTVSSNHQVIRGPYGVVSQIVTGDPGWFDNLGSNATALAHLTVNNGTALAVIDPCAIATQSGGVVFLSDMNALDDWGLGQGDNQALALNAIRFVKCFGKVRWDRPNMRLKSCMAKRVTPAMLPTWDITLEMDDDNSNPSLGSNFRRWWHCEIGAIDPIGETLNIKVTNAGYGDRILPVVSTSTDNQATWSPYSRVDQLDPGVEATYAVRSGTPYEHHFTLKIPAGQRITDIRLAKYFPYTIEMKDLFIAAVEPHQHVQVDRSQRSEEMRVIEMLTITDHSAPTSGKKRVWIHSGTHPSETTSYFTVEGLVEWLLSGSPATEALLDSVVFNIVPMANPDGVEHGNYRTNAKSNNLESQWGGMGNGGEATAETKALKHWISSFMGTASAVGEAPIELLFNLHSSHNVAFPFHFIHCETGTQVITCGSPPTQGVCQPGVSATVRAKELSWVTGFEAASPFVALGRAGCGPGYYTGVGNNNCCSRASPSVLEAYMYTTYSKQPAWADVMAITFEGTYVRGPGPGATVAWNTMEDYRQVGREMAQAICDYLAPSVTLFGAECAGTFLSGTTPSPRALDLTLTTAFANSPAAVYFSLTRAPGIPLPFTAGCKLHLLTLPVGILGVTDSSGLWILPRVGVPGMTAAALNAQGFVLDANGPMLSFWTSNGLSVLVK